MIVPCSTLRIGPYLIYTEKFITQFKTTEKNDVTVLVLEKMTIYLYDEVPPQRKSRHFLMQAR